LGIAEPPCSPVVPSHRKDDFDNPRTIHTQAVKSCDLFATFQDYSYYKHLVNKSRPQRRHPTSDFNERYSLRDRKPCLFRNSSESGIRLSSKSGDFLCLRATSTGLIEGALIGLTDHQWALRHTLRIENWRFGAPSCAGSKNPGSLERSAT